MPLHSNGPSHAVESASEVCVRVPAPIIACKMMNDLVFNVLMKPIPIKELVKPYGSRTLATPNLT